MFTTAEARLLDSKLEADILNKQNQLNAGVMVEEKRQQIEQEIVLSLSILTKLQRDLPKKKQDEPVKVLVVDDVSSMRQVNSHMIKEIGFLEVDSAENGLKALTMLQQANAKGNPYSVVVSDWEMPEMSGVELLRAVRADKNIWRTPFYLLTSKKDKEHVIKAVNAGASGYMIKPINQKILKSKLDSYLA